MYVYIYIYVLITIITSIIVYVYIIHNDNTDIYELHRKAMGITVGGATSTARPEPLAAPGAEVRTPLENDQLN